MDITEVSFTDLVAMESAIAAESSKCPGTKEFLLWDKRIKAVRKEKLKRLTAIKVK